ncbi:MAG: hypothetical protein Q7S88_01860 [Candidatus Daviesbacteria bacterium]|nr:hypothetical protein [Candidatus Daviesbacteria bacterium]
MATTKEELVITGAEGVSITPEILKDLRVVQLPIGVKSRQWVEVLRLIVFPQGPLPNRLGDLQAMQPGQPEATDSLVGVLADTNIDAEQLSVLSDVYEAAKTVLERVATTLKQPVLYRFDTRNPNLQQWAENPQAGGRIFDWEQTKVHPDGLFEASTTIHPQL